MCVVQRSSAGYEPTELLPEIPAIWHCFANMSWKLDLSGLDMKHFYTSYDVGYRTHAY